MIEILAPGFKATAHLVIKNKEGQPGIPLKSGTVPNWAPDAAANGVLSLFPADDGMTCVFQGLAPGTSIITLTFQSLAGVTVTITFTVTVQDNEATTADVIFDPAVPA